MDRNTKIALGVGVVTVIYFYFKVKSDDEAEAKRLATLTSGAVLGGGVGHGFRPDRLAHEANTNPTQAEILKARFGGSR